MKSLFAGLLAALSVTAWAGEPVAACRVPGLSHEVLCGSLQRALDPARPAGVRIPIHYVVVPARARHKLPDPVLFLAGGPGQSAIALAPSVLPLFSRLNNRRDIVFVDQRGTGRSEPLKCQNLRHQSLADQTDPDRQVRDLLACRDRLAARPALGGADGLKYFTTVIAMQDLDAVRRELGAERINIIAASYGTRAALDYLRQFPAHVRRAVLDGVAPPDMALPLSQSIDGQAVLDAMLEACAREAGCAADYPLLRQDWQALLARLPLEVEVPHPVTGRPERLVFTRDMVLSVVRSALYVPGLSSALPAAIHAAAQGQVQGLTGLGSNMNSRNGNEIAAGMHFSVVCAEDMPLIPVRIEGQGKDFGDGELRFYRRVCAEWPRGDVPRDFYTVPRSSVPVMLLSGGLDPATPPRHGERVAAALGPQAMHVVVDNAGHGLLALGCLRDVWFRFLDAADDASALRIDTACAKAVPRPPALRPVRLPVEATP